MELDLKGCNEIELMSYKIILLKQLDVNEHMIEQINKKLINIKEKEENAQTKN